MFSNSGFLSTFILADSVYYFDRLLFLLWVREEFLSWGYRGDLTLNNNTRSTAIYYHIFSQPGGGGHHTEPHVGALGDRVNNQGR